MLTLQNPGLSLNIWINFFTIRELYAEILGIRFDLRFAAPKYSQLHKWFYSSASDLLELFLVHSLPSSRWTLWKLKTHSNMSPPSHHGPKPQPGRCSENDYSHLCMSRRSWQHLQRMCTATCCSLLPTSKLLSDHPCPLVHDRWSVDILSRVLRKPP